MTRKVAARSPARNVAIQRQAIFNPQQDHLINPAGDHLVGKPSLGFTPPVLNDVIINGNMKVKDFRGVIVPPKINTSEVSGLFSKTYRSSVAEVGINRYGYFMHLPEPGPWRVVLVDKDAISKALSLLSTREPEEIDRLTVEVTGKTDHAQLAGQILRHESVHAEDIRKIAESVLVRWDANLTRCKDSGQIFEGKTAGESIDALYRFVGGTPAEIERELFTKWEDSSRHFHDSERGKTNLEVVDFHAEDLTSNNYKLVVRYNLTI